MMHYRTPRENKQIVIALAMVLAFVMLALAPALPAANAQTAQPQAPSWLVT